MTNQKIQESAFKKYRKQELRWSEVQEIIRNNPLPVKKTGLDWHDKKRADLKIGIVDLDSVEYLEIESDSPESIQGEDTILEFESFVAKHPDFVWDIAYEGNYLYLFSKKPELIEFETTDMLHRGATGRLKNAPKNALIFLDMD